MKQSAMGTLRVHVRRWRELLLVLVLVGLSNGETKESRCDLTKEFQCRDETAICIPLDRVRDGRPDCPDKSDEECEWDEFRCVNSPDCIPRQLVQDGWKDCPDGSDEECRPGQFSCLCGLPRCVDSSAVSNGIKDCNDGSDETPNETWASACPEDLQELSRPERHKRQAGVPSEVTPSEGPSRVEISRPSSPKYPASSLNEVHALQSGHSYYDVSQGLQQYGSLSSGKIYQTAVNELASSLSSNRGSKSQTVLTRFLLPSAAPVILPYNEEVASVATDPLPDSSHSASIRASPATAQDDSPSESGNDQVTAVFPTTIDGTAITVTGTEAAFVHSGDSVTSTYNLFTGSYVGGEQSTYMFFFGNRKINGQHDGSKNSENIEVSMSDNIQVMLNTAVQDGTSVSSVLYGSGEMNGHEMEGLLIEGSKQFNIHGATPASGLQPTLSTMAVKLRMNKNSQQRARNLNLDSFEDNQKEDSIAVTSVTGRRVGEEAAGQVIITDQFILPSTFAEDSTEPTKEEDDTAVYIKMNEDEPVKPDKSLRKNIRPTKVKLSGARIPTRTIGRYGPIYEEGEDIEAVEKEALLKLEQERKEFEANLRSGKPVPKKSRVTLFGFVAFTTEVSGTEIVFMPTANPQGIRTAISKTKSAFMATNRYKPSADDDDDIFGTDTREFVSQKIMITTTVNEKIEMPTTMFTSTVAAKETPTYDAARRAKSFDSEDVSDESLQHTNLNPNTVIDDVKQEDTTDDIKELSLSSQTETPPLAPSSFPTGLVSSITGSDVTSGMTTLWTTNIIATYIDGTYAHIIESTSSIFFIVSKTDELTGETISVSVSDMTPEASVYLENELLSSKDVSTEDSATEPVTDNIKILTTGFLLPQTEEPNSRETTSTTSISDQNAQYLPSLPTSSDSETEPSTTETTTTEPNTTDSSDAQTVGNLQEETTLGTESTLSPDESSTSAIDLTTKNQAATTNTEDIVETIPTESPENVTDVVILRGNFILPNIESSQKDTDADSNEKSTETVLTDSFILPDANVENNLTSPLAKLTETSTSTTTTTTISLTEPTVQILTDMFILPGQSENSTENESSSLEAASSNTDQNVATAKARFVDDEMSKEYTILSEATSEQHQIQNVNTYPVTYYTTYTYFTTFIKDGSTTVSSSEVTSSQIFSDSTDLPKEPSHSVEVTPTTNIVEIQPTATQSGVTYYTTYTHYTTYYRSGIPITSSREETTSSVIYAHDTPQLPTPSEKTEFSSKSTEYFESFSSESSYSSHVDHISSEAASIQPTEVAKTEESASNEQKKPTTYYTTYTYYTTLYRDGSTVVNSRLDVQSEVLYDSTPTVRDVTVSSQGVVNYPTTYFTTYTYYTTYLRGTSTVVSSRKEIVSNVIGDGQPTTALQQPSITRAPKPTTYYTTYTYYTTLIRGGTTTISTNMETVSNVVTNGVHPTAEARNRAENIAITATPTLNTYYTTYTYYTTKLVDGKTVVNSDETTITSVGSQNIHHEPSVVLASSANEVKATFTPSYHTTTQYTTYTYYTTLYSNGEPVVQSSTETFSNVVTVPLNGYRPHEIIEASPSSAIAEEAPSITKNDAPILEGSLSDTAQPGHNGPVTTYYTTFTYYTTLLRDGSVTISSRYETVSNTVGNVNTIIPTETRSQPEQTLPAEHRESSSHSGGPSKFHDVQPGVEDLQAEGQNYYRQTVAPGLSTYYTTYTYFTTVLNPDGNSVIHSRLNVVSSVVGPGQQIRPTVVREPLEVHSTRYIDYSDNRRQTTIYPSRQGVCEVCEQTTRDGYYPQNTVYTVPRRDYDTVYTTYTYYTTHYPHGRPVVETRYETKADIITRTISPVDYERTVYDTPYTGNPNDPYLTYRTTYTYHTTVFRDGTAIVTTSKSTITNTVRNPIVTRTRAIDIQPTAPAAYAPEFTNNGYRPVSIEVNGRKATQFHPAADGVATHPLRGTYRSSDTVRHITPGRVRPCVSDCALPDGRRRAVIRRIKVRPTVNDYATERQIDPNLDHPKPHATPSKATYYTTYTYFTTLLENGSPVVSSREQTLTQEYNNVVLPSRALAARHVGTPAINDVPDQIVNEPAAVISPSAPFGARLRPQKISLQRVALREKREVPVMKPGRRLLSLPDDQTGAHYTEGKYYLTEVSNDIVLSRFLEGGLGILVRSVSDRDLKAQSEGVPPTGLIQSVESKAINDGVTTVYATEVYGTYINGVYSQVVQSAVRIYSDPSNEIEPVVTKPPDSYNPRLAPTPTSRTGLLRSTVNSEINLGTTTYHTTNIFGTFLGGLYAHVAQTTSSVKTPELSSQSSKSKDSLVLVSVSTEANGPLTTYWTTEVYGTHINGFYAHVASTYSVISPTPTAQSFQFQTVTSQQNVFRREPYLVSQDRHPNLQSEYRGRAADIPNPFQPTRSVGLVSSIVSSTTGKDFVTYYTTEVHGTYIGNYYAQIAKTSTRLETIPHSTTEIYSAPSQKIGLVSSSVLKSEINQGTTTLHLREIYGTYFGEMYAHIAKGTTKVIYPTSTSSFQSYSAPSRVDDKPIGIISSTISTEVNNGVSTLHTTEYHGTYISGFYAHIAKKTSSILRPSLALSFEPESSSESLISSSVSTEVNAGTTTLHTRAIYGTNINGFFAHVARTSSSVLSHIGPTQQPQQQQQQTGAVSTYLSSEWNNHLLTIHTTEVYGTYVNGFYAHVARSSSQVVPGVTEILPFSQTLSYAVTPIIAELQNDVDEMSRSTVNPAEYSIEPLIVSYAENPIASVSELRSRFEDFDAISENTLSEASIFVPRADAVNLTTEKNLYNLASPYETKIALTVSSSIDQPISEILISSQPELLSSHEQTPDLPGTSETPLTTVNYIESSDLSSGDVKQSTYRPSIHFPSRLRSTAAVSENTNDYDYEDTSSVSEVKSARHRPAFPSKRHEAPKSVKASSSSADADYNSDIYDYPEENDEYEDLESRKNKKPNVLSRRDRLGRTDETPQSQRRRDQNQRNRKNEGNANEYDEYPNDYEDLESTSSKAEEPRSIKEKAPAIQIRPFRTRERAFAFPTRTTATTKAPFTLRVRSPTRPQKPGPNQRGKALQAANEDYDDDEENIDEESDIDASEAVLRSSPAQTVNPRRGRPGIPRARVQPTQRRGNQRASSVTNGQRRRPGVPTRSVPGQRQTSKPSLESDYQDYPEENTTEEDEEILELNIQKGRRFRPLRSTQRPAVNQRGRGGLPTQRRSGIQRSRTPSNNDEEEVENRQVEESALAPNSQRSRAKGRRYRGRTGRPNLKTSFNSVNRDEEDAENNESLSVVPFSRLRGTRRRSSYNPRTRRLSTSASTSLTLTKPPLTVTDVVTTVKTLPIYHGFRTSYATLTTTTLTTSIIQPSQYSTVAVNDDVTKTLFSSRTAFNDGATTITEVVVTTTHIESIKIVPIKIGFSTRTDTLTEHQVLTTLSTLFSTISPETSSSLAPPIPPPYHVPYYGLQQPQNPEYSFLTSANSFVTTATVTSTTVIPINLRGRIIYSTLTTTALSESTVFQTTTVKVPQIPTPAPFIPQPYFAFQPLTTQLTLYLTGDNGDIRPVITNVAVPYYQQPPVFHTKVARSLQSKSSLIGTEIATTKLAELPQKFAFNKGDLRMPLDTILSSGLEIYSDSNYTFSSAYITEALDSSQIEKEKPSVFDITTVFSGPVTEVYVQKAVVEHDPMETREAERNVITDSDIPEDKNNEYGIGYKYNFRKLQQFEEDTNEHEDFADLDIDSSTPTLNNYRSVYSPLRPVVSRETADRNGFFLREGESSRDAKEDPNTSRPELDAEDAPERQEFGLRTGAPPDPNNDLRSSLTDFAASFPNSERASIELPRASSLNPFPSGQDSRLAIDNPSIAQPKISRARIVRPVAGVSRSNGFRRFVVTRPFSSVGGVLTEPERSGPYHDDLPEATPAQGYYGTANRAYDVDNFQFLREPPSPPPAYVNENSGTGYSVSERTTNRGGPRRSVIRRVRPTTEGDFGQRSSRPVVIRRSRVRTTPPPETPLVEEIVPEHSPALEIQATPVQSLPEETTAPTKEEAKNVDESGEARNSAGAKPVRRIIKLRRPDVSSSSPRRKVLVSRRLVNTPGASAAADSLQGRGPVSSLDNHVNALEDNSPQGIEAFTTQPIPITYYTTYTYYTTFLHGLETVYTSSEAVVSRVALQTVNPETVRVIQSLGGYSPEHDPSSIIPLGSRSFGPTTTVVNLASRVQIFNNEVYSGVFSTVPTEPVSPTQVYSSSAVGNTPRLVEPNYVAGKEPETVHINQIAPLSKTFYTLFTYYYTFYDGLSTRQSVRAETLSTVVADAESFLTESVSDYINSQGLLTVGPDTRVINLGSRSVDGTTTEVNLGLRTLIHFDQVNNVVIQRSSVPEIQPSQVYQGQPSTLANGEIQSEYHRPVDSQLYDGASLLQPSYSSEVDPNAVHSSYYEATPEIPLEGPQHTLNADDRRPYRVVTTVVQPGLQSRVINRRPGVRVRVRPASSRRIILASSVLLTPVESPVLPQSDVLSSIGIPIDHNVHDVHARPPLQYGGGYGPQVESVPTAATPNLVDSSFQQGFPDVSPITDQPIAIDEESYNHEGRQASPPEEAGRPGSRRRLKITVRRPSNNVTRTNSRFVLPSRFEITSRPRIYVVTRTGPVGVVQPTKKPLSVKINRRPKPGEELDGNLLASGRLQYETYTTLTTVPVIFGLETSYRSVLLTTSSAVVVPYEGSDLEQPVDIQPTRTVVFTYYTTTTFTVPYTVGDQTLLTTVEETNSRIVTQTYDNQLNEYSTVTRASPASTSVQFGPEGLTTHIKTTGYDGTTTSSILYPGPNGSIRGTKVIRTDPNGIDITSVYGAVPEGIQPSSPIRPPQSETLPPVQVFGGDQPVSSRLPQDGVMLIVGSGVDGPATQVYPQPSTALTLQPTLVTDVVLMKDKGGELDPAFSVFFNTRTFFTTYTYFTTFFSDSSSIVTSSEQVVSNVVTVPVTQRITPTASPTIAPVALPSDSLYTVFETSDRLITSTAYSTFTIYATLFNGSSSFVTPLEEVHTQMYTITEPVTFTRVITPTPLATFVQPTPTLQPSTFEVTTTYYTTYTNFVTFFQGTDTIVSSIQETASSVATLTLFGNKPSDLPTSSVVQPSPSSSFEEIQPTPSFPAPIDTDEYTTRTYVTTQTHYITLFSGSETVLSSIEEVGTQVRTEKVQATPSLQSVQPTLSSPTTSQFTELIKETESYQSPVPTVKVEEGDDSVVQLQTSVRTLYTTFTYYTTYFSDTNTFISSREDVSTSYVTLFIPKTITPTTLPSSSTTYLPESSTSVLTTTEYSTLTLYTTLFDGGKEVVISSEHVVPEVITATVTMTSDVVPEPSPTLETVLTYFTTYTFYDTYVSGSETLLTPSESVITNYVTASGPVDAITTRQTESRYTDSLPPITISEDTPPASDIEIVNVVTIVSSEVSSAVDSDVETRVETNVGTENSVVDSKVEIRTQIGDFKPTETIKLPGSSTRVIDSSTIVFFTDIVTESSTDEATETSETSEPSIQIISVDIASSQETIEDGSLSTPTPVFIPSATPTIREAVTSTVTLESSTEFVGQDHETTKLPAGALLILVTGVDGSLTRLTEAKITGYADTINPTVPLVEDETPSTQTSNKPTIKPGSVIELSDLLGGNSNLGGNIGEAIKGIVNLITAGKKKNDTSDEEVQPVKEKPALPPRVGMTVSQSEEPVYIPIGAVGKQPEVDELQPVFTPTDQLTERTNARPDVIPVYPPEPTQVGGNRFTPGVLVKGFTPLKDADDSSDVADKAVEKSDADTVKTDVITGAKTVFLFSSTSDPKGTSESSVQLQGSVETQALDTESSKTATPVIQGTSVITGAKTIFLGDFNIKETKDNKKTLTGEETVFFGTDGSKFTIKPTEKEEASVYAAGFIPLATSKREGGSYTTVTKDGQTIVSKSSSGAKTIFFPLGGQPIEPSKTVSDSSSTKFVTRVESLTRTLTLTTTKIYYTRDSPITITSVLTTTIPPRTFVSTIVGSRTILGTLSEPSETVDLQPTFRPSESTTTITTTTKIFNSIATTVVRTLVIPTKTSQTPAATRNPGEGEIFEAATEKPAKPPQSADSTTSVTPNGPPKFIFGPQTTPRSATGRRPILSFKAPTRVTEATSPKPAFTGPKLRVPFPTRPPTTTTEKPTPGPKFTTKRPRFGTTDADQELGCYPECNVQNKEVCKNNDGIYSCDCRPGFARKDGSQLCEEIQTYIVTLRVVKMGESAVSYRTEFSNSLTTEFQQFAQMAKKGIDEAYKSTDVRDNYVGSDVRSIVDVKDLDTSANDLEGVLVNFTVQVSRNPFVSESQLKEELTRSLKNFNYSVGGTDLYVSPQTQGVGDVQDFDECSNDEFNDCGRGAFCTNMPGSYNCTCKDGFKDLDSVLPGRVCSGEIKNCDYCNGRGDCITSEDGKRSCKCHRMYVGRRCEINGLVLAITLPLAAGLVVLLICCLFCCCRRYRRHKRTGSGGKGANVFKGMGLINPLTGTLDRKAMIMDTSSESSESHPPRGHHPPQAFDGFAESDTTTKKGSKKSDLSLDRSLSTGFSVPPVMIPRARHQHPKQLKCPSLVDLSRNRLLATTLRPPPPNPDKRRVNVTQATNNRVMNNMKVKSSFSPLIGGFRSSSNSPLVSAELLDPFRPGIHHPRLVPSRQALHRTTQQQAEPQRASPVSSATGVCHPTESFGLPDSLSMFERNDDFDVPAKKPSSPEPVLNGNLRASVSPHPPPPPPPPALPGEPTSLESKTSKKSGAGRVAPVQASMSVVTAQPLIPVLMSPRPLSEAHKTEFRHVTSSTDDVYNFQASSSVSVQAGTDVLTQYRGLESMEDGQSFRQRVIQKPRIKRTSTSREPKSSSGSEAGRSCDETTIQQAIKLYSTSTGYYFSAPRPTLEEMKKTRNKETAMDDSIVSTVRPTLGRNHSRTLEIIPMPDSGSESDSTFPSVVFPKTHYRNRQRPNKSNDQIFCRSFETVTNPRTVSRSFETPGDHTVWGQHQQKHRHYHHHQSHERQRPGKMAPSSNIHKHRLMSL